MVGFFSKSAAKIFGTDFYLDSDGKNVEVTAVYETLQDAHNVYTIEDAVLVSTKLVKYLGRGRPETIRTRRPPA